MSNRKKLVKMYNTGCDKLEKDVSIENIISQINKLSSGYKINQGMEKQKTINT